MKDNARKSVLFFSVSILAVLLILGTTLAGDTVIRVFTKLPGVPEGVCIDHKNNLYASVSFTGELVKLNDDGTFNHVAWVPSKEDSGKGQLIGIEADDQGMIYAAYKEFSEHEGLLNPRHPDCNDVRITQERRVQDRSLDREGHGNSDPCQWMAWVFPGRCGHRPCRQHLRYGSDVFRDMEGQTQWGI